MPYDRTHIADYQWPIAGLKERLAAGDTLLKLCGPRDSSKKHDVREHALELIMESLAVTRHPVSRVRMRKRIGGTLGLPDAPFPSKAIPGLAIVLEDGVHICELKSNRTDYRRFDSVLDSHGMREFLAANGQPQIKPLEVEQDLIKLTLYYRLSDKVKSCQLVLLDAYAGPKRSWSQVFSDLDTFQSTMQTDLIRRRASDILSASSIETIRSSNLTCRLICCHIFDVSR